MDSVLIPLTRGLFARVDLADADRVRAVGKWTANRGKCAFYAVNRKGSSATYLHRFLLSAEADQYVDHINQDTLDCRRSNLRLASQRQNNGNRRKSAGCTSEFKGVSQRGTRWQARIRTPDKQVHLGSFATAEQAARAYDVAALEHFGEFALINFARKAA